MEKIENLFERLKKLVYDLDSNEDEFDFLIMQNEQEMIKVDPILFIGLKTDYYLQRHDIEKGLGVVLSYKNGKYISMEVEDFLDELKSAILEELNHTPKAVSDDKIESDLFSNNELKMANAIRCLSTRNIRKYMPLVKRFLTNINNEKMHRLLLLVLVEQQVDEEMRFYLKEEKLINPSKLKLPFENDDFKLTNAYISSLNKDPSTCQRKQDIYSYILVQAYPDNPLAKYSLDIKYSYIEALDQQMCGKEITSENIDIEELNMLKKYLF